jgi:hypothetical protein
MLTAWRTLTRTLEYASSWFEAQGTTNKMKDSRISELLPRVYDDAYVCDLPVSICSTFASGLPIKPRHCNVAVETSEVRADIAVDSARRGSSHVPRLHDCKPKSKLTMAGAGKLREGRCLASIWQRTPWHDEPETGHESITLSRRRPQIRSTARGAGAGFTAERNAGVRRRPRILRAPVQHRGGHRRSDSLVLREGGATKEVGGGCGVGVDAYVHARSGDELGWEGDDGSAHRCRFRGIGAWARGRGWGQ